MGASANGSGSGAGFPGTSLPIAFLTTLGSRSYSAQNSSNFLSRSGTSGGSQMVSSSMLFEKPL